MKKPRLLRLTGFNSAKMLGVIGVWVMMGALANSNAAEDPAAASFRKEILPILTEYCYDCHGDGMDKGKVAFDGFKTDAELLGKHDLWVAVLKNLRTGLMPPEKKPRPSGEEVKRVEEWIKREAFGIDPANPDPGRVTLRRLNREEYRNTIRDLTGFDFRVEDELPPDDTGYGFDNIGDVLTTSPMLLEKYMQAAETIVAGSVPRVTRVVEERVIPGNAFRSENGRRRGERNRDRHSFYEAAKLQHRFEAKQAGRYQLVLELEVLGEFDFDPGRCRVVFKVDDRPLLEKEFGWQNGKKFRFEFDEKWQAGEHSFALELEPMVTAPKETNSLDLRITALRVQGPQEKEHWVRPKNFDLFFSQDPPAEPDERRRYAREVLSRFASRAYRRPADPRTVERLLSVAESTYAQPGKRFEDGIAQALIPVLASPRFLFRVEDQMANSGGKGTSAGLPGSSKPGASVDEYSLASRLSYFLWSTMPDEELLGLAARGELRKNLEPQARRMLADRRSQEFVENFVGQWLQVRDVEGIDINARVILARDAGQERNFQRQRRRFQELRDIPDEKLTPGEAAELKEMREQFRRRFGNRQQVELDRDLRRALRQETEMLFAHVLREDRSVLELLDNDYTFLNEKLAKHYGITNVIGNEMRRVELAEDSPRGGVLTHGAVLIVTSNPTRTSPVKRGLFVLENILGTPTPPPPPDVPPLEESEKDVPGREPTLREILAIHREKPLCNSCHNRMDPLGLALENFNALGMWREKERGQPIDSAGRLITGEKFAGIRDIRRILVTERRRDFYHCLSEKLLTYALGRGLEYYDVETLDQIAERLEKDKGRISTLVMGVIESAPFQKRRNSSAPVGNEAPQQTEQRAQAKP